ncbi:MAG: gliding motility-associated C-terminal domain-containing protein, partial [Saprospiraceae bacterium]|nr:gliding motility-associated C-terminal domain-containing protein [Saprospiraceae bacterium]
CEVPTVITPNEDGVNDVVFINCLETGDFPNNTFVVYNQWGDEVYSASPYNNDWNGTYEGEPLPDATYYYIFMPTESSDPDKGFITILR